MRNHFLATAVFILAAFFVKAQELSFTVQGSIPVSQQKLKAVLVWNNGASAEEKPVVNGKFSIRGTISEPGQAILMIQQEKQERISQEDMASDVLNIFLDSGIIKVVTKSKLREAEVSGSPAVTDMARYQRQTKSLRNIEMELGKMYSQYRKDKNDEASNQLMILYEELTELNYIEQKAFVKANPASPVSLYMVKESLGGSLDAAKASPLFEMLNDAVKASKTGKELEELINTGKKSMLGSTAPDFVQPDTSGNPISLSSFRGKYVLVDFWASWCGPCRAESPNLVKAYERFSQKNFTIYSVSLDQSRKNWIKAIHDDRYTWPQSGDMKGWENAAARDFGIQGIPFNMLLDPNGVVIARDLRGEALEKKLEEVLK